EPSRHLPTTAFVNFAQNHDQVGNRLLGERLGTLLRRKRPDDADRILRLALATVLLAPGIPMLFMGEEFDSPSPFLYLCHPAGELGESVCAGRQRECADFSAAAGLEAGDIPDPLADATFAASRIETLDELDERQRTIRAFCQSAIAARRRFVTPLLGRG